MSERGRFSFSGAAADGRWCHPGGCPTQLSRARHLRSADYQGYVRMAVRLGLRFRTDELDERLQLAAFDPDRASYVKGGGSTRCDLEFEAAASALELHGSRVELEQQRWGPVVPGVTLNGAEYGADVRPGSGLVSLIPMGRCLVSALDTVASPEPRRQTPTRPRPGRGPARSARGNGG